MKNRITVVKVLESIIRVFGLKGDVAECVKQAQKDVLAMDRLQNSEFMLNAIGDKYE